MTWNHCTPTEPKGALATVMRLTVENQALREHIATHIATLERALEAAVMAKEASDREVEACAHDIARIERERDSARDTARTLLAHMLLKADPEQPVWWAYFSHEGIDPPRPA